MTPKQRIKRIKEIGEWAEEELKKIEQEAKDSFLEFALLGSLLYETDEHGNKTRIKRINTETEFEVKPVSIIDGKIQLDEE